MFEAFITFYPESFQYRLNILFATIMKHTMANRTQTNDIGIYIQAILELFLILEWDKVMPFHIRLIIFPSDETLMYRIDFTRIVCSCQRLYPQNIGTLPLCFFPHHTGPGINRYIQISHCLSSIQEPASFCKMTIVIQACTIHAISAPI